MQNLMALFQQIPLTGASNAGGAGRNRDSGRIAGDDQSLLNVRATVAIDDHAVYRTDGDASVNLCLSQPAAWTNTPKRT